MPKVVRLARQLLSVVYDAIRDVGICHPDLPLGDHGMGGCPRNGQLWACRTDS